MLNMLQVISTNWSVSVIPEEIRHDVGLIQYHMTLECSLERFWGVAFLATGAQLYSNDNVECTVFFHLCAWRYVLAKVKAEIAMIQRIGTCPLNLLYGSSVVLKKDENTSTDFSQVLKDGQPEYGARSYFLLRFST